MSAAGKKALFATSHVGVERDELLVPMRLLKEAGVVVSHAAPHAGPVQTWLGDVEHDAVVEPDLSLAEARPDDYDVLVVPGGTVNADIARTLHDAVRLAQGFADAGKPVACVCHAPWLLVEADLLPGKTLTSYHSIRADVVNAGGEWVDEPVVLSTTNGWPLITSRDPGDLEAFSAKIIETLARR